MKEQKSRWELEQIPITVTRKNIKNLYLRIRKEDGAVNVSAPFGTSDLRIQNFLKERLPWIKEKREQFLEQKKELQMQPPKSGPQLRMERFVLEEKTRQLIHKWEPVMGVSVSGLTFRQMKSRWGSCNVVTHKITINLALAQKQPQELEYVVIHEMAHLLEPSHNAVFWGHVEKYCPNWKQIRKTLNEEGIR